MNLNTNKALVGIWLSNQAGGEAHTQEEKIMLEFTEDGKLTYTIITPDRDQKIFLTYRIDDGVLVTDQPSNPREERTPFSLTPEGQLLLYWGNQEFTYTKKMPA